MPRAQQGGWSQSRGSTAALQALAAPVHPHQIPAATILWSHGVLGHDAGGEGMGTWRHLVGEDNSIVVAG